jgi:hypothetical protein
MTNQQWINKLRVDMKEITKKTAALDKTLVQSRTKVNGTNYIIRLNRFPSIRFQGYEYIGQSNGFYIYRQETIEQPSTTYEEELVADTSNYEGTWEPYKSRNRW